MTPTHRIAAEFSRQVRRTIAGCLESPHYVERHRLEGKTVDDVMMEVVRRNRDEYSGDVCATHDFCDANMPMFDAFARVVGRDGRPRLRRRH